MGGLSILFGGVDIAALNRPARPGQILRRGYRVICRNQIRHEHSAAVREGKESPARPVKFQIHHGNVWHAPLRTEMDPVHRSARLLLALPESDVGSRIDNVRLPCVDRHAIERNIDTRRDIHPGRLKVACIARLEKVPRCTGSARIEPGNSDIKDLIVARIKGEAGDIPIRHCI